MYVKAEDVLPEHLVDAIQEYVQGVEIYIPKRPDTKLGWGERSGTRKQIAQRNKDIIRRFCQGESIHSLTEHFHLSYDSIRKIVSAQRQSRKE